MNPPTRWPALVLLAWLTLLVLGAVAALTARYLYLGTATSGLGSTVTVTCAVPAGAPPCATLVQDLGAGRSRVTVRGHGGNPVRVDVRLKENAAPPGVLLVRRGYDRSGPSATQVTFALGGQTVRSPDGSAGRLAPRQVLRIDPPASGPFALTVQASGPDRDAPLVVDEIGLFRSADDINRPYGFSVTPAGMAAILFDLRLLVYASIALGAFFALLSGTSARWGAAAAIGLAIGFAALTALMLTNGPEWTADLRLMIAAGTLLEPPGSNLNYGMYMADSVLHGSGPLILGQVPWHRMPGYAYLLALTGGPTLLDIGVRSVFLHIALQALGLALLVGALMRLVPSLWAVAIGGLIALAPAIPHYTFIEAVMPAIACLVLAAGCLVLQSEESGEDRLLPHVLLHASFALWFAMRADALPAWILVSLALYAWPPRRWRRLVLPALFILAIGLPWALYKQRLTGDFSMTTNSIGASLMVGLWDIPNPYGWVPSDSTYFDWARANGFDPLSKAASDWATGEVLRFWWTYPGYVVALAWNKLVGFLFEQISFGSAVIKDVRFAGWPVVASLTVILCGLLLWHRPRRILLLGWIVLFNVPMFFVLYASGGRFYNTSIASLLATTGVLLADRGFLHRASRRPLVVGCAVAAGLLVFALGPVFAILMAESDTFRFGVELADPARSTLVRATQTPGSDPARAEGQPALTALAAGRVGRIASQTPIRVVLTADQPGVMGTLDVTRPLAGHLTCRIHAQLRVTSGKIAAGVSYRGNPLFVADRVVLSGGWFATMTPLDFSVPVPAQAGPDGPLAVTFTALAPGRNEMDLQRLLVHDCGSWAGGRP